jgi:hypothetical protein
VPLFAAAFQCIGRVDTALALANELTLHPYVPLSIVHIVARLVDEMRRLTTSLGSLSDGRCQLLSQAFPTELPPVFSMPVRFCALSNSNGECLL